MGTHQPVAGYSSKTDAIRAMTAQGLTPFMIAEKIGSTPGSLAERVRQIRKAEEAAAAGAKPKKVGRPRKGEPADTRGLWTPEKLAKARKLFGKTMIYIAEALQVPAGELLTYALNGTLPPIGEKQRVAQLIEALANGEEVAPAEPVLLPPPVPSREDDEAEPSREDDEAEPSREDDEAELAALEDQEDGDDWDDAGRANGGDGVEPQSVRGAGLSGTDAIETDVASPPEVEAAEPVRVEGGAPAAPEPARPIEPAAEPAPQAAEAPAAPVAAAVSPDDAIPVRGVAEAEAPARRYRLKHWTDKYLLKFNKSGHTLTATRALAWVGTAKDMEEAFKVLPELKDLDPERVPG